MAKTSAVNAVSYPGSAVAATIIARRGTGPPNGVEALRATTSGRVRSRALQLHIETKVSPLETAWMRAALDRSRPRGRRQLQSSGLPGVREVL